MRPKRSISYWLTSCNHCGYNPNNITCRCEPPPGERSQSPTVKADDSVDESMVKAIAEVGHAMGIETIAERVESRKVLEKLGAIGVQYAQGYYISRPISIDEFEPWAPTRFQQRRA